MTAPSGSSCVGIKVFLQAHLVLDKSPLHRPASECDKVVLPVNRYGEIGNIADPVNFNRLPEPLAA
jgi:hypothetical protein